MSHRRNTGDQELAAALAESLRIHDEEQTNDVILRTILRLSLTNTNENDDAHQMSDYLRLENNQQHSQSNPAAFARFVNVQNLCWLHSLTQALARALRFGPEQASRLKNDIVDRIRHEFRIGDQHDAADAFMRYCQVTQDGRITQALQSVSPTRIIRTCGDVPAYVQHEDEPVSITVMHLNDTVDVLFGGTTIEEPGVIRECGNYPATITKTRHPGLVSVVANSNIVKVLEKRTMIRYHNGSMQHYELVAVLRHSNPSDPQGGHYYADVLCEDEQYRRIDDTHPNEIICTRLATRNGTRKGVLYFYRRL